MHRSKGLEFPVVIWPVSLAGPDQRQQGPQQTTKRLAPSQIPTGARLAAQTAADQARREEANAGLRGRHRGDGALILGYRPAKDQQSNPLEPLARRSAGPVAARGWTPCSSRLANGRRTRDKRWQAFRPRDWDPRPLARSRAPPAAAGSQQLFPAVDPRRLPRPRARRWPHPPT